MKSRIIIFLSVLYIVTNFLIYYITEINKEQRIKIALDAKINQLQMHYSILTDQQTKMANAVFRLTMDIEGVKDILTKANNTTSKDTLNSLRKELINRLSYRYSIIKERGVLQYQIILPNNISFLRMHKQNKFGDDLSGIRYDLAFVNKNKKIIRGFHQGRVAHGFRNVYPIFNDDKVYIGAIEISFSSNIFQNNLKNISNVHTHFIVNRDIFRSNTWSNKNLILKYKQSSEHKDYMITMNDDHTYERCIVRNAKKLKPIRDKVNKNIALGKEFSLYNPWRDGIQTATFFPIKNSFTNLTVAWIVSYEQSHFIKNSLNDSKFFRIVGSIILLLLFYFIYRTLNQKEILDIQVKNKTKELEASEYALAEINKNLEQRIKDEVEKNRSKDQQLLEQNKMVSMGEMIGNIAHQWRQPLSAISTLSSGMYLQNQLGLLSSEDISLNTNKITEQTEFLSKTINTFRDFIKEDKEIKECILQEELDKVLSIVGMTLKDYGIELKNNIDYTNPIKITTASGELSQVIINIMNNAKDILNEKQLKEPIVILDMIKNKNYVLITIEDNGGGIPNSIIDKIFDPYFTTKHQSQGTGLGLNMSYKIITESLKGKIYVENTLNGAKFSIELPLN